MAQNSLSYFHVISHHPHKLENMFLLQKHYRIEQITHITRARNFYSQLGKWEIRISEESSVSTTEWRDLLLSRALFSSAKREGKAGIMAPWFHFFDDFVRWNWGKEWSNFEIREINSDSFVWRLYEGQYPALPSHFVATTWDEMSWRAATLQSGLMMRRFELGAYLEVRLKSIGWFISRTVVNSILSIPCRSITYLSAASLLKWLVRAPLD